MSTEKPKQESPGEPVSQEPSSWLHIQVLGRQKSAWVRAAQAKGMKLANWVMKALDDAAANNK